MVLRLFYILCFGSCSLYSFSQIPFRDLTSPDYFYSFQYPTNRIQSNQIESNNTSQIDVHEHNANLIREVDTYLQDHSTKNQGFLSEINELKSTIDAFQIQYSIPSLASIRKEQFYSAFNQLVTMLRDTAAINILRATYLVENAYDSSITEQYFQEQIDKAANHILMKLKQEGFDKSNNLAKNMMIFRYMADTIAVRYPGIEEEVISYPKSYDYDDFWGKDDYSNTFVSKLLKDGDGQCHSLPLLYLLIAERIDAKAHLALAPNHSYIKFQDPSGSWHSLELTIGAVSSDNFIVEGGFIKSEAIKSQIYLKPMSKRELVAQTINDLVMAYIRKFGYDNDRFIEDALGVSYSVFPYSITTHQIMANYYQSRLNFVVWQYQTLGLPIEHFKNDEKAQFLVNNAEGVRKHIDNLGYAPMPEEMYQDWLMTLEEKSRGQYNKVRVDE